MKNKIFSVVFLVSSFFLFSCSGENSNKKEELKDSLASEEILEETVVEEIVETTSENAESDKLAAQINANAEATDQDCGFPIASKADFLSYVSPDGMPKTFESENGNYLFFRADGTMAGGGKDGEASMWEANWTFQALGQGGQIVFNVSMNPNSSSALSGAYKVEMFPDDGALIFNCVDYILTQY